MRKDPPPEELIRDAAAFAAIVLESLSEGNSIRFTAEGASMRPFILNGDILTVAPLEGRTPRRGDVVLYRQPTGRLAAHRILGISRESPDRQFAIRGDARPGACETIPLPAILGRVIRRERPGPMSRLDGRYARLCGLLWARAHPFSAVLLRLATWTKR